MSFDVGVTNSLRSIQASAAAAKTSVDGANTSLRTMRGELQGVAAGHAESAAMAQRHAGAVQNAEESMHGLGRAARLAGGEGGRLVGHLSHLAEISPMAIAAGIGLGFIVNKITEIIEKAKEGQKELAALAEAPEEARKKLRELNNETALKADVPGLRRRAFDEAAGINKFNGIPGDQADAANEAAGLAVQSGHVKTKAEALDNMRKANAFRSRSSAFSGGGSLSVDQLAVIGAGTDQSPEDFRASLRRAQDTPGAAMAGHFERRQLDEEEKKQIAQDAALVSAAGGKSSLSVQAENDEIKKHLKNIDDGIAVMTKLAKEQATNGRWAYQVDAESTLQSYRAERATVLAQITASSQ